MIFESAVVLSDVVQPTSSGNPIRDTSPGRNHAEGTGHRTRNSAHHQAGVRPRAARAVLATEGAGHGLATECAAAPASGGAAGDYFSGGSAASAKSAGSMP